MTALKSLTLVAKMSILIRVSHQVSVTLFSCCIVKDAADKREELPKGCKILSIHPHGASFWAYTGKIDSCPS